MRVHVKFPFDSWGWIWWCCRWDNLVLWRDPITVVQQMRARSDPGLHHDHVRGDGHRFISPGALHASSNTTRHILP